MVGDVVKVVTVQNLKTDGQNLKADGQNFTVDGDEDPWREVYGA